MRKYFLQIGLLVLTQCFLLKLNAQKEFRMMFYNVENLFDTIQDTTKNNEVFLPSGKNKWNAYRYKQKLSNIYKVTTALGEGNIPVLIGLAEIENKQVLSDLISYTPLLRHRFQIVHFDSKDPRGIDVGLLYQSAVLKLVSAKAICVLEEGKCLPTRDILYGKFILLDSDTIHVFINHWSSRWQGAKASEHKRLAASNTLKKSVDSILEIQPQAAVICMGDFNDTPDDYSIFSLLSDSLLFIPTPVFSDGVEGSLKHQSHWQLFDFFVVTNCFFKPENSVVIKDSCFTVFALPDMLEEDQKQIGLKPNRTYFGPIYHGGYSDHLPVYLTLKSSKKD